jgi:hypothetical protein
LLLLLIILAFLVGVVVPLFSMASMDSKVTPVWASAILIATLALTVGSCVQLGVDVFKPLTDDPRLYLRDRWLRPILENLGSSATLINNRASVSVEQVAGLLASASRSQLPTDLVDRLTEYQTSAIAYNKSAEELDAAVLQRIQNDPSLQPFRRPIVEANRVSHMLLNPNDVVDLDRMQQIQDSVRKAPNAVLGVETQTYWGSRGRFALISSPERREELLKAVDSLTEAFRSSPQAERFLQCRKELSASMSKLREDLAKFLQR